MRVLIIFLFASLFSYGQDIFYLHGELLNADSVECFLYQEVEEPTENSEDNWFLIGAMVNKDRFAAELELNTSYLIVFYYAGTDKQLIVDVVGPGSYNVRINFDKKTKYALIEYDDEQEIYVSEVFEK